MLVLGLVDKSFLNLPFIFKSIFLLFVSNTFICIESYIFANITSEFKL